MAIGKPIRADGHLALLSGHLALLSGQGDRDALENRLSRVSCKHFVVPSTMSPHAYLARSPVGLADKVWLGKRKRDRGKRKKRKRDEKRKRDGRSESGTKRKRESAKRKRDRSDIVRKRKRDRSDIVKLGGPADV